MSGEFAIFQKLNAVRKKVVSVAEGEEWSACLANGGAFVISQFDARGSFFAECKLRLQGGIEIPISGSFAEGEAGRGLEPDLFASEVVATCRALIRDAAAHETRKAELYAMTEREVAKARRQGIPISLISITERAVVAGHPNRNDAVYFDVAMKHLGDDGHLDTFVYDAADAEEFGRYLTDRIIAPLESKSDSTRSTL